MNELRKKLEIREENLRRINEFILKDDNPLVNGLLEVVERYGSVDEIKETQDFSPAPQFLLHIE